MATVARQAEPITRAGFARLRAELDHLRTVRRPELAQDLREAREDGTDLGANGALAATVDEQVALERRIDELETALASVRVVDPPAGGVIGLGHHVRLRLAESGRAVEYELVGPLECDPASRRISVESPVGQALVGRRAGDVVDVETPAGRRTFEILAVDDPDPEA